MNRVFFAKDGLTSTSANHVANMAKEYAERIGAKVKTLRLYKKKARLMGDSTEAVIETPIDVMDIIPETIQKVAKCNALIGWLREAIKEREDGLKEIQTCQFSTWANEHNIVVPVAPEPPKSVDDIDKVGSEILNVKDRNRYIELKTQLAVYGKFIHPEGLLPKVYKELERYAANPTEIDGEGRDMVVYSYEIDADADTRLNNLFFRLQGDYRALQAELNGIEHRFRMEAEKKYQKCLVDYKTQYAAFFDAKKVYDAEMEKLRNDFNEWQLKQIDEITALRIIIPNDLQGIYAEVNGL